MSKIHERQPMTFRISDHHYQALKKRAHIQGQSLNQTMSNILDQALYNEYTRDEIEQERFITICKLLSTVNILTKHEFTKKRNGRTELDELIDKFISPQIDKFRKNSKLCPIVMEEK